MRKALHYAIFGLVDFRQGGCALVQAKPRPSTTFSSTKTGTWLICQGMDMPNQALRIGTRGMRLRRPFSVTERLSSPSSSSSTLRFLLPCVATLSGAIISVTPKLLQNLMSDMEYGEYFQAWSLNVLCQNSDVLLRLVGHAWFLRDQHDACSTSWTCLTATVTLSPESQVHEESCDFPKNAVKEHSARC
jgi:hypothetical protein